MLALLMLLLLPLPSFHTVHFVQGCCAHSCHWQVMLAHACARATSHHHCSGVPLRQALVRTLHRQGHAVVQGVACGVWRVATCGGVCGVKRVRCEV